MINSEGNEIGESLVQLKVSIHKYKFLDLPFRHDILPIWLVPPWFLEGLKVSLADAY